ncbi:MAG: hypothetical protein GWP61_19575 [Chloroflexi bacterium]|nr:hypothetical protein [Chloroflexota bacterium]
MSSITKHTSTGKHNKLLTWEIAAVFFILLFGSGLHFAFELSNFWYPVAPFAAVNESIWEHLKMVFWPALIFFTMQYAFLKNDACAEQFWTAKALCLVLMPLLIAGGWYAVVAVTGEHYFVVDIALFVGAIIAGQLLSYAVLSGKISAGAKTRLAFLAIFLLALAFVIFSFYPPKLSLFEHGTLENTGQYGILQYYHD